MSNTFKMSSTIIRTYNSLSNKELGIWTGVRKRKTIEEEQQYLELFNKGDYDICYERLCQLSKSSKYDYNTTIYLLEKMESELISKKQLVKACQTRELRNDIILKYYELNGIYNSRVIWALVSKRRFDEASFICKKIKQGQILRISRDKFDFLGNLLIHRTTEMEDLPNVFDIGIKNKKVHVYGPLSKEIPKSFDKSISIGYKGGNNLSNISFYNNEAAKVIQGMENRSFLQEIDYSVFFKLVYPYQKEMFSKNKAKFLYTVDFIFDLGQPNMLQNMLFHILRNQPKEISIDGFNLYYSKTIYGEAYNDYKDTDKTIRDVQGAFSHHNIISQYTFTKMLYDLGYLKCDNLAKNVLDLGLLSYMLGMEEIIQ